jgi:hypothetical protein
VVCDGTLCVAAVFTEQELQTLLLIARLADSSGAFLSLSIEREVVLRRSAALLDQRHQCGGKLTVSHDSYTPLPVRCTLYTGIYIWRILQGGACGYNGNAGVGGLVGAISELWEGVNKVRRCRQYTPYVYSVDLT